MMPKRSSTSTSTTAPGLGDLYVADGVLELADRSLLVADIREDGSRYRMLETMRAFARERLAERGERVVVQRSHAQWALARARQSATELDGPDQVACLAIVEEMIDDHRSAMAWSQETGEIEIGAEISTSLYRYWYVRAVQEGSQWMQRFAPLADELPVVLAARLLYAHGSLLQVMGEYERSAGELRDAVARYRDLDDERGLAYALHYLGRSEWGRADAEDVRSLFAEALELFRSVGDPVGEGLTLLFEAIDEYIGARRPEHGLAAFEECDAVMRSVGAPQLVAHGAEVRALVLGMAGHIDEAVPLMREAIELYTQMQNPNCGAHCMENTALLLAGTDAERALMLLAAATRLREEIGVPVPPYENLSFEDARRTAEAGLDEERARQAWRRGAELDFAAALETADDAVAALTVR